MDMDKIVDLYIRVSTSEQAEEGYSVGEQEERLKSYCAAFGYQIHAIHTDPGFSGASLERPGIQKVISDVKNGLCKKVIVWKLDRLSRSQKDTLILLEDVFLANDCHFISLMESFDTSTPFGRCLVGILAAFAQMERENIKMRTAMGIQASLKQGYYYGAAAPVGYVWRTNSENKRELATDPQYVGMIKELYERLDTGQSLASIAEALRVRYGFWKGTRGVTASELSRIAKNRAYCGYVTYGDKEYRGRHESLVDEDLWNRVYARLQKNIAANKRSYTAKSNSLLSGLLFCGDCGARMSLRKWDFDKGIRRYVCYSVGRSNPSMIKDPNCTNRGKNFKSEDLDELILNEIRKLALDQNAFHAAASAGPEQSEDTAILHERMASIDRQIDRLLNLYQNGILELDEISERINELKAQRNEVSDALDELQAQAHALSKSDAWDMIVSLDDVIDRGNKTELYTLVHALIDKIVVYKTDVTIYWSFC